MLARVVSCDILVLDGAIAEVEVDTSEGLPSMIIVGLLEAGTFKPYHRPGQ